MDSTVTEQELLWSMLVSSFHLEQCSSESKGSAPSTRLQVQPGGSCTARQEFCCATGQTDPQGQSVPEPGSSHWSRWMRMNIRTFRESGSNLGAHGGVKGVIPLYFAGITTVHADGPVFSILDRGLCRDWQLGVSMAVGCTKPDFCLCCNFQKYFLFLCM